MTKEQWELYKEFCEFAGLQDNSDAEIPNVVPGMEVYIKGSGMDGWDPPDDPLTVFSPEFLVFILMRAKEFYKEQR